MDLVTLLFFIIPLSSIGLLFLKDHKKERKIVMNVLLITNALFFLSPLLMAYMNTPPGESMWNENTGGGAAIWLYIIIFPISGLAQLTLIILKAIFASNTYEKEKEEIHNK